jgi:DNA polymerase III sliding clamp (beta) subunit (PCNA family)
MYNKNNLAVANIASKSSIKPELASVLFEKDATVATDSFKLVRITTPKDLNFDDYPTDNGKSFKPVDGVMLKANHVKTVKPPKLTPALKKSIPELDTVVVNDLDDDAVEFVTTDCEVMDKKRVFKVNGTYPKYEQVIPKTEPTAAVMINVDHLLQTLQVLKNVTDGFGTLELEVRGVHEPVIIKANNGTQEGLGLVMPMNK